MLAPSLQEIAPVLQGREPFSGMTALTILQRSPECCVFRADWRGRPVVVKLWRGAAAHRLAGSAASELKRASAFMTGPTCRVVSLLHDASDLGAVVMSCAPGCQLSDAMRTADAVTRETLTRLALGWLWANAAPTLRDGRFAPLFWVRRFPSIHGPRLAAVDRSLVAEVLDRLRGMAPRLRGMPVAQAVVHSDFSVFNLSVDGQVVTAYDMHEVPHSPVVRSAARLLVSQRPDRLADPSDQHLGVDRAMLRAALSAFAHSDGPLTFFVGEYLLDRYLAHSGHPRARPLYAGRLASWLAGTADQAAPST